MLLKGQTLAAADMPDAGNRGHPRHGRDGGRILPAAGCYWILDSPAERLREALTANLMAFRRPRDGESRQSQKSYDRSAQGLLRMDRLWDDLSQGLEQVLP
jgi:hypothetical protein